ncbi:MAG: thioredoxin family protein [Gammaproteobacteria bacterium]
MVAALSELAGIEADDVEVFLDRDAFTVSYDSTLVALDDMYEAITNLGYTPGLDTLPSDQERTPTTAGKIPEPVASALIEANSQQKLLFLEFYAEWCIACKALEETTFSNPEVQAILDDYLVLKIDTDVGIEASSHFRVVGMPTLLVLDAEGKEITRLVGMIESESLVSVLQGLLVE